MHKEYPRPDNVKPLNQKIKQIPIEGKKNELEEVLKKDNSTEALAKAIRTLLNKDNK